MAEPTPADCSEAPASPPACLARRGDRPRSLRPNATGRRAALVTSVARRRGIAAAMAAMRRVTRRDEARAREDKRCHRARVEPNASNGEEFNAAKSAMPVKRATPCFKSA